ncbi:hypothetical protein [Algoriphagus aquimarinus]|uniref:Viral A-type inclusion protein n=1 Tax=Algoriphagus aquimarinus TaxID=237018 RepID=A0A1I0YTD2_9BACT|nr:hypothetical protein [Algoriphagus aquimarinus]SFB16471.1 hypothetical protein SAMN04489723_10539 [Algoriphagus aquimarinus]|tara:strand:+ start:1160 stop:1579 length:420 start_codon:yes stop_codon:yes gene_type:complete
MKRTILFLILTSFLLINACGPSGPSDNEKLRAEVIAVHDEVMPKMGQLKSLERKALEKAKELESQEEANSAAVEEYKALAYDLNHAHESMFAWMRQYEQKDGEMKEAEVKAYLDKQMELVTEVNVEMKAALEKADKLLK